MLAMMPLPPPFALFNAFILHVTKVIHSYCTAKKILPPKKMDK